MLRKITIILAALLLVSCGRFKPAHVPDPVHADALIEAAHLAHDADRILALADSLEAAGDISTVKADYWRGYGYYSKWNNHMCREYWYAAISREIKTPEDLEYYGRAANRLSDVMLTAGDYEAVLRVALPAIEKMRQEGVEDCRDFGYLLVTMGCYNLHHRHLEEAADNFDEAYTVFTTLIEDNGIDGKSSHLDNLKSAVAGLTTIARHYLEMNSFEEVLLWVDRLEEVMEDYRRQPETTQESLNRRQTLCNFFRATALEGLGRHPEAVTYYELALQNPFASTAQGRVEGAKYLMMAKRWNEAAASYSQLESVASSYGVGLTLDNIETYLLPKFRANFYARHNDEALTTGLKICEALDSAIVWSRRDKAAELETVYHTQAIKEGFLKEKANLERQRFIFAVAVILLLIVSFIIFIILRHRSSMRLGEAYRKLAVANAHAEEASRVKTAFLQQISHEIRTPINLLSGFAQVLTEPGVELDDESRAQINEGVLQNTGRITGLISKIIDLSDLISTPDMESTDRMTLGQIASEAASASGIMDKTHIRFDIQATDEIRNKELITNRKAVIRILALLLENGAKFTKEGSVVLRVVTRHDMVYYMVEDTGIGVPAEEAEHIFEHFVQLDDYQEGTGIGLSLARSLARRLGGDVVLDTSYTFGARFIFSLPLSIADR